MLPVFDTMNFALIITDPAHQPPHPPPFQGVTNPFAPFALITDGVLNVNFPPISIMRSQPPRHPSQEFHWYLPLAHQAQQNHGK